MTTFTIDNLHKIIPTTALPTIALYVDPLNKTCAKYSMSTIGRASMFIAQVAHESAGLTAVVENLNYSQQSLRRVFPKYFPTDDLAGQYARQPEKIASRVYANRMGNGNEASGDGWTYRGRGGIQITGRDTYKAFANSMQMTLADAVAYLGTPEGAMMSAGWFWDKNSLNTLADQSRFTDITKRINGGVNGLAERIAYWNVAKEILS